MKLKLKLILTIAIISAIPQLQAQITVPDESLNYDVMFKWGLINKKAGSVTITTQNQSDGTFDAVLIGKSATWADRFYTVRDTLMGSIQSDGLIPLSYQKISHEGGEFKKDIISYQRSGDSVTATCNRYKQKKSGQPITHSQRMLSANGYTLDMLTAFFYMRFLNYPELKVGDGMTMNIFSGKRKEILKITYHGEQQIEDNNHNFHNCYYITFSFTSDDGKKSSDDLQAWISTEANRIPLKLQGKLPVGVVRCYYVP